MSKLYFFSGSFDPPHLGHREIAKICRQYSDLLIVFPTHQSPNKSHTSLASDYDRKTMVELNFSQIPDLVIDDFELNSERENYTIDTIKYIKQKFPADDITLVLGGDQWNDFKSWYRWKEILDSVNILCFNRDDKSPKAELTIQPSNVTFFHDFHFDISSTHIRTLLKTRDMDVRKFLFDGVFNYIIDNNLYL